MVKPDDPQPHARARPDASMSLLSDLFAGKVLDPPYREAAERRVAGRPRRRLPRGVAFFATALLLGTLGAVSVVQVRRDEPVAERQREVLTTGIRDRTAETDAMQRQVGQMRAETERMRENALTRSKAGKRAQSTLDRAEAGAAAKPVKGSGFTVTVDDAPPGRGESAGRIVDRDLQIAANGLFAAGADAVAINEQRLTATSPIRSAGEAILVDYRALSRPYTVVAHGDSDEIASNFADSAAGRHLRTLKITFGSRFDTRQEDEVRLPAATGQRLRYAREEGT